MTDDEYDRSCFVAWYRGFDECARIIALLERPNGTLPHRLSDLIKCEHKWCIVHGK